MSARGQIIFIRAKIFSIARAELSRECVAMQKFPIAQIRSGSHRNRSRDRSEISRGSRTITQHRNSLYDSHSSRRNFLRACYQSEISLSPSSVSKRFVLARTRPSTERFTCGVFAMTRMCVH